MVVAELLQRVLVPFLFVSGLLLLVILGILVLQRMVRGFTDRRRQTLIARYRPLLVEITQSGLTSHALDGLRLASTFHPQIIRDLLLAPLHAVRGDVVRYVRDAATAVGLVDRWQADLESRHWWRRADGIRALGLVEAQLPLSAITRALGDHHAEVRAAAIEAVGRLADVRAIPALLEHLADVSHAQRARVVDALRSLGPGVTPALLTLARARPDRTLVVVEVLGLVRTAAAIDPLVGWCADPDHNVRAAALEALGSIGLDDRTSAVALRALTDGDPQTRAMAARALGRGHRGEAVPQLARGLDDDWAPAAQAAAALRRLGAGGIAALESRALDEGQAGDLARQMLWRRQPVAAGE